MAFISFKYGQESTIPNGALGEPLFTNDTNEFYIGTGENTVPKKISNPLLAGFTLALSKTTILATDTVLQAFGKVQKYLNDLGDAAFKNTGTVAGTLCAGDDNRLSDTRTPISHNNTYHSETYLTTTGNGGSLTGLTKSQVGLSNVSNTDCTTTANIDDSTNKRFCTDAQKTIISNTSNTNTGDETTATIKTKLGAAATGADGYLTSADWNTFNAKEPAITKNTAFNKNYNTDTAKVKMDGSVSVGTEDLIARADHVHPSDTTKQDANSNLASINQNLGTSSSPTFAGTKIGKAAPSSAILFNVGADTNSYSGVSAYGTSAVPSFYGARGRGTHSSPAVVNSGDDMLSINAAGQYTSTVGVINTSSKILVTAAGDFSNTSTPSKMAFYTTTVGSHTPTLRLTLNDDGKAIFTNTVQSAGYVSSDGSAGATGSFASADGKTVTIKDGLVTSIV